MSRENILHKVRTALGRSAGQAPAPPPAARLRLPEMDADARVNSLMAKVAALAGKTRRVDSPQAARDYVAALLDGRRTVASNAPFLAECGITALAGVRSGISAREDLRQACASADLGVTCADYALADTGTLVMLSSREEARLISLLPPVHVAVVPQARILTGLDELFTLLPRPAEQTSSMVLITGPSRTADIEQILVRGVHGPGEIHVVVVG
ncbi:MAG TPA: lactate utilization protein [Bryobacteraceae bacterium]|nr:lactate utilization protein [Bryobacteraceae bacterium]